MRKGFGRGNGHDVQMDTGIFRLIFLFSWVQTNTGRHECVGIGGCRASGRFPKVTTSNEQQNDTRLVFAFPRKGVLCYFFSRLRIPRQRRACIWLHGMDSPARGEG